MIHGPWLVNLSHPLVLASASPRRTWILSQLGIPHSVDPAHIDEDAVIHPDPAQLVLMLARDKAMAISHRRAGELVLGADTVVYLSPDVLGKPKDAQEARKMLQSLSGKEHVVWTGIHLALDGVPRRGMSVPAVVRFRNLSFREIDAYVDSGDPMDKAGSYGIQGAGLGLVSSIDGCFYGVAGLPVAATLELLRDWETSAPKEPSHA
jgi:septum formation protein